MSPDAAVEQLAGVGRLLVALDFDGVLVDSNQIFVFQMVDLQSYKNMIARIPIWKATGIVYGMVGRTNVSMKCNLVNCKKIATFVW